MPCDEFVKNFEHADDLVPDAVVKLTFDAGMSPAKAWRTHLELTHAEVAWVFAPKEHNRPMPCFLLEGAHS